MASSTVGAAGQLCSQLPPGFRFHPTDQELLTLYLKKKVTASLPPAFAIIAEIDLYKFNPWELPGKAFFGQGEWFFFSPRDRKYPNGVRPNRAAACGYWKATGTDKPVLAADGSGQCLGVKKALVFYKGRPPKGIKTNWVMHEYRLLDTSPPARALKQKRSMRLDDWVLCRVRQKGSMSSALENDGATEFPNSPESLFTNTDQQEAKQQVVEQSSSPAEEWNDQQLLGYLLGSFESTGESSDPSSAISFDAGFGSQSMECFAEMHHAAEPPQIVSTVLSSIKRKLSFGMLDELMLMPPGGKRQQCWVGEIASIDEFFI